MIAISLAMWGGGCAVTIGPDNALGYALACLLKLVKTRALPSLSSAFLEVVHSSSGLLESFVFVVEQAHYIIVIEERTCQSPAVQSLNFRQPSHNERAPRFCGPSLEIGAVRDLGVGVVVAHVLVPCIHPLVQAVTGHKLGASPLPPPS